MKNIDVINIIKSNSKGVIFGKKIDDETTRDKILYGNPEQECTGIVTTCFASARVIQEARKLGCNLIIPHEALFWNHGDHQEWLQSNRTYIQKKKLLDDGGITVWRDHDYIHSGISMPIHQYVDGIFYGFAHELGWEKYIDRTSGNVAIRDMDFLFPGIPARQLASEIVETFHLNGTRIAGDPDTIVNKLRIVGHIDGRADNEILTAFEEQDFDCAITLECTDYTFQEYIRDSAQLALPKAIIMLGHFNTEEPGMKFIAENWLPKILPAELPIHFVASGDPFKYIDIQ
ncbi:MAG: Nif3-like dinuclear metal center hexameric protein [Erysipelotrichaceae bacterium]|nr:Nif3-like dinuclear metal center hexameric protein [Erysipelotrichaceae bacterium]